MISETWRYAVSNLRLLSNHPLNGAVTFLLSHIFVDALTHSERQEIRSLAANNLIAFWIKVAEEMPASLARPLPDGLEVGSVDQSLEIHPSCHEGILRHYFLRLRELPDGGLEDIMRSYYQLKKLGGKLLPLWPEASSYEEYRRLMTRLYRETYEFWLQREDPCRWLLQQTGFGEESVPPWFGLCTLLGHDEYHELLRQIDREIDPETDHRAAVSRLIQLPDYHEIVRTYFKQIGRAHV